MSVHIPPRWLQCPRTAIRLVGERFLAFKTPLNSNQIPHTCIFTPSMIASRRFMVMHSYEAKLGLWINLTNIEEFYDKAEIESRGIFYLKLPCRGNNEYPDLDQTREFINICSNFTSERPSQLIGIHCIHGFNTTGFLIVAYLVEKQSWDVGAAVTEFARARPPGIYEADYLRELFTRYGDPSHVPTIPLPDWCQQFYNDTENVTFKQSGKRSRDDNFTSASKRHKMVSFN